jgi:hypothetical protein
MAMLCGHCVSNRTLLFAPTSDRATLVCFDCGWLMPVDVLPDGRLLVHPDPDKEPPLDQAKRAAGDAPLPGLEEAT